LSAISILKQCLEQIRGEIWLAFSGGMDSHVLLHMLANHDDLTIQPRLKVIHIDHGLHPESGQWAQHCAKICADLQIPITIRALTIPQGDGESLEALAREARYQIFQGLLTDSSAGLMTAHHQNDQAETFLLQLLRGCGVKGLAAMPQSASLGRGTLWRPFLNTAATELKEYANDHQLNWLEDPSNALCHFDRNLLRHQILPLLTKRWPKVAATISRTAHHCATADHLLMELAQQDIKTLAGSKPKTLSVSGLLKLSTERQGNVLRYYFQRYGWPLPSTAQLQRICQDILLAREDANPCVTWADRQARRYRDDLYVLAKVQADLSNYQIAWDGKVSLSLPVGVLHGMSALGQGIALQYLPHMTVCFRQGGERCHMQGKPGSHPLKKLMQEWDVPSWQRDKIPLIKISGEIAVVVGYGIGQAFAVQPSEPAWQFSLSNVTSKNCTL
jgi:tRNA(Ile)-lysidine synthase